MLAQARPISELERAPAPGPVIVSALAAALLRRSDHRDNRLSFVVGEHSARRGLSPYGPTLGQVRVALNELQVVAV